MPMRQTRDSPSSESVGTSVERLQSNLDWYEQPQSESQDDEDIAKMLSDLSRVCVSIAKRLQEGPDLSHLDRLTKTTVPRCN